MIKLDQHYHGLRAIDFISLVVIQSVRSLLDFFNITESHVDQQHGEIVD
jgi:hypothetical protein